MRSSNLEFESWNGRTNAAPMPATKNKIPGTITQAAARFPIRWRTRETTGLTANTARRISRKERKIGERMGKARINAYKPAPSRMGPYHDLDLNVLLECI